MFTPQCFYTINNACKANSSSIGVYRSRIRDRYFRSKQRKVFVLRSTLARWHLSDYLLVPPEAVNQRGRSDALLLRIIESSGLDRMEEGPNPHPADRTKYKTRWTCWSAKSAADNSTSTSIFFVFFSVPLVCVFLRVAWSKIQTTCVSKRASDCWRHSRDETATPRPSF